MKMSDYKKMVRKDLFKVWLQEPRASSTIKMQNVRDLILEKARNSSDAERKQLKKDVSRLCSEFNNRWNKARRTHRLFESSNKSWLSCNAFSCNSVKGGRPKKPFSSLNRQNKRRRVKGLRLQGTTSELAFAAGMNARSEGCEDAAKLMQGELQATPNRAREIRKAVKSENDLQKHRVLTNDEGLGFFIDGDFSRDQWILLRKTSKQCNAPQIYPSYKKLVETRQECLPDSSHVVVTEVSAEVHLQALMDHTVQRILSLEIDGIEDLAVEDLELISKWGFDGSSDHSNYKQKFEGEEEDDSSIFITSMVPLLLRVRGTPERILWMNRLPSSTRLCRPIRIQFKKETTALSLNEKKYIDTQIKNLIPSMVSNFRIHHTMVCSMIDGKVCSALTGISSQKCCVCEASPKQFNNIKAMQSRPVNRSTFEFGLSPLHARIR